MAGIFRVAAFCSILAPISSGWAAASPAPSLLARLIALSSGVKSYTADVEAHVAMHTFPYLSPTLEGKYYHKEPSMDKIVFTGGLPFIAQEFSRVYPRIESPSRWQAVYRISTEGQRNGITTFRLVPRKHGRVDHIDAEVDDKTAELLSLRWVYTDGGYATLHQRYALVQGHELVTRQTGHFDASHYDADLTSMFSHFHLNARIPNSAFSENG